MASKLNPYITFDGTCEEAMKHYAKAFGAEARMMTFEQAGMTGVPGIMHASVESPEGWTIYASDTAPGMPVDHVEGNNLQISLSGDDAERLRTVWEQVTEGGQVIMPLEQQMWGDTYGLATDRFGIAWHCNIATEAA